VTGRADGSSRFGPNNKFAYFPSAAFAWRVSEEGFWKKNDLISNLKLRTSYGLTGNSEIRSYEYLDLLSNNAAILNEVRVPGTGLGRLANPDLKWEKTAQTDLGLELGLLNNRITLEADYYYRKTTDMLLSAPVPRTSGYSSVRRNIGSMSNRGVELAINSANIRGKDLSWNTSFNISFNRNKILSLATPADIFDVGGPNLTGVTNVIRVGEAAGSFYGLTRLGVWGTQEATEAAKYGKLPGDVKHRDVNGDFAYTDADRGIIGNGSPKAWGSLFNTFKYKNLDLLVDLQYSYGNDVMDLTLHPSEDRQTIANSYKSVLNAWTPQNQNTMIGEVRLSGSTTTPDSHWVKDGSFVRGRNIMLGYTLSKNITNRMKINSMRLYTSAQNLFLLVDDEVVGDPETTPIRGDEGANVFSQGQNYHGYPRPRTFMFGLQIGL
jgi:TonB-linked SusC/RagA family outer membrane protein